MTYKLLDLYCGAGGGGAGYSQAGFKVTGIDYLPQKGYPFNFIRADALQYLQEHYQEYDAIHASPPCQRFSNATPWTTRQDFPDHVTILQKFFDEYCKDIPWAIENVERAPLRNPIKLCGTMFNLRVIRHRIFESNVRLTQPLHPKHVGTVKTGDYITVAGHGCDNAKGNSRISVWQEVMQMPWVTHREGLAEAIPPPYTKYIGNQLMNHLVNS